MQTVTIQMTREELERLIETTVERRLAALHLTGTRKHCNKVSLRKASKLTQLTINQLRYIEQHPSSKYSLGYPGRIGHNPAFIESALRKWAELRRSTINADRAIRQGLDNPLTTLSF